MLLSLPALVVYPLLFAWVSYQALIRSAEYKRRLQVMSARGGMTGVYNRRHQELLLRSEFDNCRRHQRNATLFTTDINHLRSIDDTWGRDVGDQAIVTLTRQLRMTLHGGDMTGRFGGDEFAVIICDTSASSTIAATPRVHERLTQLRSSCAPQTNLCISVGVTPLMPEIEHYQEWSKSADMALCKAKDFGYSRIEAAT